ncbi:MAG: peptidoglycan-binding protein [Ruminococcaceae bacterium]|nr:peptidoglycan-binding protein [Oscillospiraceae bacterium]
MIILIFHPRFHTFERYELELFEPMPYTHSNALTVSDFRGDSRTSVLWTTKPAMDFWMDLHKQFPYLTPLHAFSRIGEGRHVCFSKHYTGEAFDLPFPVNRDCESHESSYHIPVSSDPFPGISHRSIDVHVLLLQDALMTAGFDCDALDGHWGDLTERALCAFCKAHRISYNGSLTHYLWKRLLYCAAGCGIKKYPHK